MTQPRDLQPVTVYLHPHVIKQLERLAKENASNVSAEARRIIVKNINNTKMATG